MGRSYRILRVLAKVRGSIFREQFRKGTGQEIRQLIHGLCIKYRILKGEIPL